MALLNKFVKNVTWYSSQGGVKVGQMSNDHLLNAHLWARRREQEVAHRRCLCGYVPEYHGYSWAEWSEIFNTEIQFRADNETLKEALPPKVKEELEGLKEALEGILREEVFHRYHC